MRKAVLMQQPWMQIRGEVNVDIAMHGELRRLELRVPGAPKLLDAPVNNAVGLPFFQDLELRRRHVRVSIRLPGAAFLPR